MWQGSYALPTLTYLLCGPFEQEPANPWSGEGNRSINRDFELEESSVGTEDNADNFGSRGGDV